MLQNMDLKYANRQKKVENMENKLYYRIFI